MPTIYQSNLVATNCLYHKVFFISAHEYKMTLPCYRYIIITRNLYCAAKCSSLSKLRGAGHCTSAKRMTSILRHVAEAFPPARQGTIIHSNRVISIATNTSMVLNCALVTYVMMAADVGLPDAVLRHTQDVYIPRTYIYQYIFVPYIYVQISFF